MRWISIGNILPGRAATGRLFSGRCIQTMTHKRERKEADKFGKEKMGDNFVWSACFCHGVHAAGPFMGDAFDRPALDDKRWKAGLSDLCVSDRGRIFPYPEC